MKFFLFFFFTGSLLSFTYPGKPASDKNSAIGNLTYQFTHLPSTKGVVRVVLYNKSDQFLSENGWCRADSAYIKSDGSAEVSITGLSYGNYAAALYLDENQNGVIDRNLMGIPTEAYGFSNNVRAKWNVPGFEKTAFFFQNNSQTLPGSVQYWSKQ
jgi:uncharacterized protein (DUF2141 family)